MSARLSHFTSVIRSNVAIRFISLTFVVLLLLYSLPNAWTAHQALVPTHQTEIYEPSTATLDEYIPSTSIDENIPKPSSYERIPSSSNDFDRNDFETPVDSLPTTLTSRIGKVCSLYYNETSKSSQTYERALLSHKEHDQRYGYKHFVQRHGAIEGAWSKHAYLIHILVQELNKSPTERLDWLFWHDADVVLLNGLTPLEVFLPPDGDKWAHINFLASNDGGGLNDGVFFVRVCEWSVYLFAAVLSYPTYHPKVHLRYDEQTALEFVLGNKHWKNNTLHVPQRWFNAYNHYGTDDSIPEEWDWRLDYVEPGDLLVHLPGTAGSRNQIIDDWLEKLKMQWDTYNVEFNDTALPARLKEFWELDAATEDDRQDTYWRHYHLLNKLGNPADDVTREGIEKLREKMKHAGNSGEEIEEAVKVYEKSRKEIKKEILRDYERAIFNGTKPDNVKVD